MSTLKTHNLQSADSGSVNIALAPNAGMVVTGISTFAGDIDVDGHTNLDNVSIAGVTTSSNKFQVNGLGIGIQPIDHHHIHIESANPRILIRSTGTNAAKILFGDNSSNDAGVIEYAHSSNNMMFNTGNVERLRIDSAGTIGYRTGGGKGFSFNSSGSSADAANVFCPASYTIAFGTNSNERLRIDSTGNIGIAGSPKTVNTLNTIEIGNSGLFGSQIAARTVEVGTNCYYNSGWKYKHADKASLYYQYQGYHSFETAATGSADGAISFQPRLLIDNNGYVTISNQPSFLVAPANDAQTANGNVTYTTVFHNTGTHYSTSTGRFTAPVTGYYTFGANFTGQAGNQNVFVRFYINGALNQRGQHYSGGGNSLGTNVYMSCDLSGMHTLLQKDDYVQLNLAASTSQGQSSYMRFYGYLVH